MPVGIHGRAAILRHDHEIAAKALLAFIGVDACASARNRSRSMSSTPADFTGQSFAYLMVVPEFLNRLGERRVGEIGRCWPEPPGNGGCSEPLPPDGRYRTGNRH